MKKTSVILFSLLVVLFAFVSCDTNATGSLYVHFDLPVPPTEVNAAYQFNFKKIILKGVNAKRGTVYEQTYTYINTHGSYYAYDIPCGEWVFHGEFYNGSNEMVAITEDITCKVRKDKRSEIDDFPVAYSLAWVNYHVKLDAYGAGACTCSISVDGADPVSSYVGSYSSDPDWSYGSLRKMLSSGVHQSNYSVYDRFGNLIVSGNDSFEVTSANIGDGVTFESVVALTEGPKCSSGQSVGLLYVAEGTQIEFSCDTEGATIYYTMDGSDPTKAASGRYVYTSPITFTESTVFLAYAESPNLPRSGITRYNYGLMTAPVVMPEAGDYYLTDDGYLEIEVSCVTSGSVLRGNIVDRHPNENDSVINGSLRVSPTKQRMVVWIGAFKDGMFANTTRHWYYLYLTDPEPDHESGTYYNTFQLALTCQSCGSMTYKVDDGNATTYSGPIAVDGSKTIKVQAVNTSLSTIKSKEVTLEYTLQVATPQLEEEGGLVTITSETQNAVIHYTTDGSTPTESSPVYSSPIAVSAGMTVNAVGFRTGFENSDVSSVSY